MGPLNLIAGADQGQAAEVGQESPRRAWAYWKTRSSLVRSYRSRCSCSTSAVNSWPRRPLMTRPGPRASQSRSLTAACELRRRWTSARWEPDHRFEPPRPGADPKGPANLLGQRGRAQCQHERRPGQRQGLQAGHGAILDEEETHRDLLRIAAIPSTWTQFSSDFDSPHPGPPPRGRRGPESLPPCGVGPNSVRHGICALFNIISQIKAM